MPAPVILYRLPALLLAATLAMAACSDGDSGDRDAAVGGTSTTSPPSTTMVIGDGATGTAGAPGETDATVDTSAASGDIAVAGATMTLDEYKSELAIVAARGLDGDAGRRIEVDEMQAALVRACQLAADGYAAVTDPAVVAHRITDGIASDPTTADVTAITSRAVDVYFEVGGCAVDPGYLEPVRLGFSTR